MNCINIASYNCKNFRGPLRSEFILKLLNECDFILIQEHWLLETQFHMFDVSSNDIPVAYHGVSAMNQAIQKQGRPFGGVAIIWNSQIKYKMVPVATNSTRLCCVQIFLNDDTFILLFNAYMPCLCLLSSKVIYSYECMASGSQSLIDHILISQNMKHLLLDCYTTDDVDNGSDHNAVIAKFDIPCHYIEHDKHVNSQPKVSWYKAQIHDIEKYKTQLDKYLQNISIPNDVTTCRNVRCTKHHKYIEEFYNDIVQACIDASSVLPHTTNNKNNSNNSKKSLPGWNKLCKEKRKSALFWHRVWKSAGRPRTGELAQMRRYTRSKYHKSVKYIKTHKDKLRSEQMANTIVKNKSRDFWKEVKSFKGKRTQLPYTIDGATGDAPIANVFATKFQQVFNSVGYDEQELNDIQRNINNGVMEMSDAVIEYSLVKPSDIENIIKSLKAGKSDGNGCMYSDHFKHGTEKLFTYIALLFNCMLIHNVSPHDMLTGTIVPIPKGKRLDLSMTDNFRGICLQSMLCKILDIFMLNKEKHILGTSHAQFGFKEDHSSTVATSIVTESIDYFQSKGGNVYVLALDATKAFDRVDFSQLFNMLSARGFNPLFTRLLFYMYVNQKSRVRYNKSCSEYF